MSGGAADRSRRLPTSAWLTLLAVALLIRLGWGLSRPVGTQSMEALPDQREYLELGRNLLNQGSLHLVDPRFDQKVYAFRMPGYPLLVAACGGSVRGVRITQAVLDTGTVAAAGLLSTAIFGSEAAAFTAAVFVAVNPFLIYFSGLVLSDTLYAALFTWALVLLQRRKLFAGTILLVLAVLVRPSGLLMAIVLPAVAAMTQGPSVRSTARATCVAFVLISFVLLPWAYRNHQRLNAWIFTTTNAGFTLYDGFHDGATGESDQRFVQAMPELRLAGEVARSRILADRAATWIRAHPWACGRLAIVKLLRFWSPVPLSAGFDRGPYRIVGVAYASIYLLALYGLWMNRGRLRPLTLMCTAVLTFSMIHAASVGSLRYRLPLEPAIAVLAGAVVIRRPTRTGAGMSTFE